MISDHLQTSAVKSKYEQSLKAERDCENTLTARNKITLRAIDINILTVTNRNIPTTINILKAIINRNTLIATNRDTLTVKDRNTLCNSNKQKKYLIIIIIIMRVIYIPITRLHSPL